MEKTSVKQGESRSVHYHEKEFLTVQSNGKTKIYREGDCVGFFFALLKT